MSFLGSLYRGAQALGSVANNVGAALGTVQGAVKDGIHYASNVVGNVGQTLTDNAGAIDDVGLGGVARYAGSGMSSGGSLGHAVANLVGSRSLGDALRNGVNVYKKGLNFVGDVANTSKIYSPISKN